MSSRSALFTSLLMLSSTVAMAQESTPKDVDPGEVSGNPNTAGGDVDVAGQGASGPTNEENLPTPRSDNDPTPIPSTPAMPAAGIVSQAGIGGAVAYGRRGVLELGGSAGFTAATDYRQLIVAPSVGWFLTDNFELSAILSVVNAKTAGTDSTTLVTALLEPSYHIPVTNSIFGFLGVGMGVGYVKGPGTGFALAPRAGVNYLVGRSGILTPAVFFQYTTHEATQTANGAVLAVSSAYGIQLGYTVMW